MAKRFVVDLQRPDGRMLGTRAEFDTATEAADYMDVLENQGNGSLRAICWLEPVPESFEATTERLLARIMEIAPDEAHACKPGLADQWYEEDRGIHYVD